MFERLNPFLKLFCLLMVLLILYQGVRLAAHRDPLAQLHIPTLLTVATNAPTATNAVKSSATNAPVKGSATNRPSASTNSAPSASATNAATNVAATPPPPAGAGMPPSAGPEVLSVPDAMMPVLRPPGASPVFSGGPMAMPPPTGLVGARRVRGGPAGTVSMPPGMPMPGGPGMPMGAMPPGLGAMPPGMGGPMVPMTVPPDAPAEVKPILERILQSEIFGPIPRPMPMALLGIAGKFAILRAPEGQSGLLGVGEVLGSIKLLRIGTNRVLVEEKGEEKELTIFNGLGSESLLPKGKQR